MGNAMCIGNDDGRTVKCFGFQDRFERMYIVAAHSHLRYKCGTVRNGLHGKIFFARGFSFDREFCAGTDR